MILRTLKEIQFDLDQCPTDDVSKTAGTFLNRAKTKLMKLVLDMETEYEKELARELYPSEKQ